jgi:hypothetical protein
MNSGCKSRSNDFRNVPISTAIGGFPTVRDKVERDTFMRDTNAVAGSQLNLRSELEHQLLGQYGPLVGGAALHKVLGFPTASALRQAETRGQVGVPLFGIANRRGKFALTSEVATWLAECRAQRPPVQMTTSACSSGEATELARDHGELASSSTQQREVTAPQQ